MADKLGLGSEVRQLKLGQSFTTPRSTSFHTIRYDFKPASVDINKMANVDVGNNNQVSVTVPHLDGAGVPQTLFKGSQKPYQKECVLIIDRVTGEITLEKLSSNIQVKKTRAETYKPPPNPPGTTSGSSTSHTRPLTPVDQPQTPITQRSSSKTRVTSGSRRNNQTIGLIPKHSPLHASPSHHPSPSHGLPPPRPLERPEPVGQSTLASLPMIGLDDIGDVAAAPPPIPVPQNILPPSSLNNNNSNCNSKSPIMHHSEEEQNGVGLLSESSSSSSSDSESDSESDNEASRNGTILATNGRKSPPVGPPIVPPNAAPSHLLNEDLCLSESATDSD